MRGQLLSELETLQSVDDLTLWALRRLPLKIGSPIRTLVWSRSPMIGRLAWHILRRRKKPDKLTVLKILFRLAMDREVGSPDHITPDPPFEPAVVQLPKTLRRRDKAHLAFVASQPCLVCQRTPSDAHHLRFAQPRALGRKPSDEFTVPLCRAHHRELHRSGNERSWWTYIGIVPLEVADRLWHIDSTRSVGGRIGVYWRDDAWVWRVSPSARSPTDS